jgi:hypothetical protein
MSMTTKWRDRNPQKHEYEVQRGSTHLASLVFVGNLERTAVRTAAHMLRVGQPFEGETHVRLYHTHQPTGSVRRYVGKVTADGNLHLPR